jgi:hypothetical protein
MRRKQIIVAAVGEKGVQYGKGNLMPQALLDLVATSKADSWTLTPGGAIAYFLVSRRGLRLLECFLARAEDLRTSLPLLGIGVSDEFLVGQFIWFGRLKPDFRASVQTEQHALANVQGAQTYRGTLEKLHEVAA